jgi:hypothetical protein
MKAVLLRNFSFFCPKKETSGRSILNEYHFFSIRFARYGAFGRIIRKTTLFG